jgi:hypothetical protein
MKKHIISLGILVSYFSCFGQDYTFELGKELLKEKSIYIKQNVNSKLYNISGYIDNNLLIVFNDSLDNVVDILSYDENTGETTKSNIILQKENKKITSILAINNNTLIVRGLFNVPDSCKQMSILELPSADLEHQDIWALFNDTTYLIKSFPYAYSDKVIESKISNDKRYLICNHYYAGIDILAEPEDNVIRLYDITRLSEKIVTERIIPCERCFNTYIFGDTLIFGKEFTFTDKFGMDYTYRNIYKSPLSNINDTIIIARDMELVNISADKKYILGKRKLYGKELSLILNTTMHRYQYIIGRSYNLKKSFYSQMEKKFVFDLEDYFIYLDFENQYPYDALIYFKPSEKKENEKFWDKHIIKQINKIMTKENML